MPNISNHQATAVARQMANHALTMALAASPGGDWYIRDGNVYCADHHKEAIHEELRQLSVDEDDEDDWDYQYSKLKAESIEIPQACVDLWESLECCDRKCKRRARA